MVKSHEEPLRWRQKFASFSSTLDDKSVKIAHRHPPLCPVVDWLIWLTNLVAVGNNMMLRLTLVTCRWFSDRKVSHCKKLERSDTCRKIAWKLFVMTIVGLPTPSCEETRGKWKFMIVPMLLTGGGVVTGEWSISGSRLNYMWGRETGIYYALQFAQMNGAAWLASRVI